MIVFCKDYFKYIYLENEHSNIVDVCSEHQLLKYSTLREIPLFKLMKRSDNNRKKIY